MGASRRSVLCLLLLAASAPGARAADPTAGDFTARVDAVFAGYTADTPGCAVGVTRTTRRSWPAPTASADLEHGVANTPDTVFEAGSVSKQFTAAAILLLVQAGKLKLDDPCGTTSPSCPTTGARSRSATSSTTRAACATGAP